jgi:hypothetical protein
MVDEYLNTEERFKLPYVKKEGPIPRIPRKTHRVWVTDPIHPTDCIESIEEEVFEELLKTNKVLEATG